MPGNLLHGNLQIPALEGDTQMHRSTIQHRINRMGKIIGLDDFHAHCIRKSRLSSVYDITGDLALAAELANHKSKTELRDKLTQIGVHK